MAWSGWITFEVGKDASLCVLLEGGLGHGGAKGILILATGNVDQTNAKRSACEELYVQDQSLALFPESKEGFSAKRDLIRFAFLEDHFINRVERGSREADKLKGSKAHRVSISPQGRRRF